jgi:2'-5' RNA ligase
MRRRLFFALNLDAVTVNAVKRIQSELEGKLVREVRFMPPENWHITVSFLGEQDDAHLIGIMNAARAAAKHFQPIGIAFERILYGPPGKFSRMIWMETGRETSRNVNELKTFLENRLASEQVPFQKETRPFTGHITLARFVEKIGKDSLPYIEKPVHLKFVAESLDLVESELKKTGAEYTVLQNFPFKNID